MTQEERFRILQDIVKMDTVNGNEKQVADYLQALLKKYDISCRQIEYAENRNQLIAVLDFGTSGKTLGFSGHMDVVPAGEAKWQYPPFSGVIKDDKLYGRGSVDMKSGLAALVVTMVELKQSGIKLNGKIKLLATVGEETATIGAAQLTRQGECDDLDALVIAEPTNLEIAVAHKGILWFRFITHGKTAHGSMPKCGVNAIDNMLKLIERFKTEFSFAGIEDEITGAPTFSLDMIQGGKATNVIPDQCKVEFDIRTVAGQDHAELIQRAENMIKALQAENADFKAGLEVFNNEQGISTDTADDFVRLTQTVVKDVIGTVPEMGSLPGATDGAKFVQARKKFPIIILGPSPIEMAHQPNEYVELKAYEQCIEIYKKIAMSYLS